MKIRAQKLVKIVVFLFVITGFYFLGYFVGNKNLEFKENFKPKIINTDLGKPKDVDFSTFWTAWNIVKEKYVGDFDTQKMVYGAIKGMMDSLGDPYSQFMEPESNKMLLEDLSGQIQGIGAEITEKDGKIIIISPLADSPAEKSGLKAKDEIMEIDGEIATGMDLNTAISKIRGKAGTEVTLLIKREGSEQPIKFVIKRARITIKSVEYKMLDNKIGYIKISQFGEDTSLLAQEAARNLNSEKPKSIILDMRGNPGGYLDAAVDVSSLFMDRGVVVKEKYRDGKMEDLNTTIEGVLKGYKIIVLIDEGSASASEIVAGALKDSRGATIIGKKSFGKGSVQELEELKNNSSLRITVAKWLTPKGTAIDKEGISPDIEVNLSDEDISNNIDPQLNKAIEEALK